MSEQAVFPEWSSFLETEKNGEQEPFIKQVVKRSGEIKPYDRTKIYAAIGKAIEAVEKRPDPDKAEYLTAAVEEKLKLMMAGRHEHSIPAIEEIQDIVESVLIENNAVAIAKAYILYRARHEAIRDTKNLMLDINATMDGYLSQSDWRGNENTKIKFSFGGLIMTQFGTNTAN